MPRYCSTRSLARRVLFLFFLFVFVAIGTPSSAIGSKAGKEPEIAEQYIKANYITVGLENPAQVSWKKKIGESNRFRGIPQMNSSTPLIFGGSLYTGTSTGAFHGFKLDRGKPLWTFESESPIEAAAVANNDLVCFATLGGTLYCLDRLSGVESFNYQISSSINSAPIMDSKNIYFISTNNRLHAINLSSGKKRWSFSQKIRGKVGSRFLNTPAQSKDKLFILLSSGDLIALGKETGKELWRKNIFKGSDSWLVARRAPLYLDGHLYIIDKDGAVVVLDADSGELRVVFDVGVAVDFLVTLEHIVVATKDELISIDMATGNTLWIESVTDGSIERIFGAGSHIYVTSSKEVETLWIGYLKKKISYVTVFTIDDGTRVWKRKFRSGISANVAASKEKLSILTDKGKLYVFNSRTR